MVRKLIAHPVFSVSTDEPVTLKSPGAVVLFSVYVYALVCLASYPALAVMFIPDVPRCADAVVCTSSFGRDGTKLSPFCLWAAACFELDR